MIYGQASSGGRDGLDKCLAFVRLGIGEARSEDLSRAAGYALYSHAALSQRDSCSITVAVENLLLVSQSDSSRSYRGESLFLLIDVTTHCGNF